MDVRNIVENSEKPATPPYYADENNTDDISENVESAATKMLQYVADSIADSPSLLEAINPSQHRPESLILFTHQCLVMLLAATEFSKNTIEHNGNESLEAEGIYAMVHIIKWENTRDEAFIIEKCSIIYHVYYCRKGITIYFHKLYLGITK
ncbi:hypothetical protein GGI25_001822 [Coemansia spiralis]|uniref:Uncharacterized protein n=2 Tax=Coemansia TaxID=4863 RepID=A0A9W8G9W0_9FUNG|nr:hypothetical protein BX070DRAFT_263144 [Coemansia spiralis]KAJ1993973.1 hypothetical protein EDC05_001884 [Coemansia umbellata]KAJ2622738.1 hypothetical protein GGI26_003007 [Coemansia sp. RSA 1358]KAJ2679050.1 hypothetical protein GGI25_001822 [Coemansia spiralis]